DRLWIEDSQVDTARNHADAGRIDRVPGLHEIGDVVTCGDDDAAARHDRIVLALQREGLVIGAMIGGDEWHARALAREPGRPGRSTRSGMDQGDLAVA